jgi:hypothetical protein
MAFSGIHGPALSRALLAVAIAASLVVSACSAAAADPAASCDAAVAQAVAIDPGSDTIDAFDGAIAGCPSLEAWVSAAKQYPDTSVGQDPVSYAATRCRASGGLAGSAVCARLAGQ